jgi:phosphoenolpyruvate carboxykinase (ATP)
MKKSLFKLANFILPRKGGLALRASAFTTEKNNTCMLIGLPGSGKGSLGIHAKKEKIIANDEVIWTKDGIQNMEGGVYAKILNLRNKLEDEV